MEPFDITRPTVMEVNLENFRYNVRSIKKLLDKNVEIMPVMKANAYGTYINTRLNILNEFNIVAVATCDEGEALRKIGYKKEIFVLNQPYIEEIDKIIKNDLCIGICSDAFVECLGNRKDRVKVHIEIGTGMGRTGINPKRTEEFIEKLCKFKNIEIEGIYTHLSSADSDMDFTNKQLNLFENAVNIAKTKVKNLKYIHACASNGIVNFKEAHYNLVRPGMLLYGYESGENILNKIELKPVCKLRSKIILLKQVEKGASIGYGRGYIAQSNIKVATVPIGYADGLRRILSNRGAVCINGKLAPIIGNICMDSCMVDVSKIEDVALFDDVWIWDNEFIKLEDIAKLCDTINYEIISTISARVGRYFVGFQRG